MSELPEKDISNVVQCRIVFYNKLSWFVSELPEKDISNVMVQCRIVFYNKLLRFVSELPEKRIFKRGGLV